jgi:GAF domain-containing protein/anti-sigma regulatory factor (Ser/Thr protein kinase)
MLRDGAPIGVIAVGRSRRGPFSDNEIELLKTFADQAVIAIENASLFEAEQAGKRQLIESLEYQTAITDVLAAISSSPNELQPVFEAIVQSASRLCDGEYAIVNRYDGKLIHLVAQHNPRPAAAEETARSFPRLARRETSTGARALLDGVALNIADVEAEDFEQPEQSVRDYYRRIGVRALLAVPMMNKGNPIGAIQVSRAAPGAFSPRAVELLKTFADQAVIAIENARLLSELRESLQQQTATADVLKVISRSAFDLQTVLDTLVASAAQLCEADIANIWRPKGGATYHLAASYGAESQRADWLAYREYLAGITYQPERKSAVGRTLLEGKTIQIDDVRGDLEYDQRGALAGVRTVLGVPLLRNGRPIGVMVLVRATVNPFTDKQVELIEAFADQAVIAIENTRLFEAEQTSKRELEESLEYQTAISDVLDVSSRSPGILQPVLDTIVKTSERLCHADRAQVYQLEHGKYRVVAHRNTSDEFLAYLKENPYAFDRSTTTGRAASERKSIHVPNVEMEIDYDPSRQMGSPGGARLSVPLLRNGVAIGVITAARNAPTPFTDAQIALVETFADQAVIAIENTRLFEAEQTRTRELSLSLEQQTATSEVLQVISSSPTNVQPVFDAIVRRASSLCGGEHAIVTRYDGMLLHLVAQQNPRPGAYEETARFYPQAPRPDGALSGRALLNRTVVHIPDIETERLEPSVREAYRRIGLRAVLCVPMVHEGQPVGVVSVSRGTTGPFSDSQIDLLKTFADQAVIAIENTRLFEAEQASKRELQEALEYQTATAEVLNVISRSPTDAQPVFDAIAESARTLCDGYRSALYRFDGTLIHHIAYNNWTTEGLEVLHRVYPRPPSRETQIAQSILDGTVIHVPDMEAPGVPEQSLALARALGYRSILAVPMRKEGRSVGAIAVVRAEPRAFSERQIELVKTFADQAVIAIENTRLFEEVQARTRDLTEALEQQTATADVLKAISRSAFNLQPVLDTLVESAARLCEADSAAIHHRVGDDYPFAASYGFVPEFASFMRNRPFTPGKGSAFARAVLDARSVHIPDVQAESAEKDVQTWRDIGGYRTTLASPLLREGSVIGAIVVTRKVARPFTQKQIELVESFADQAVIAIENTRLLEEVQARTRELAKTVEDLEIASQHKSQFVANMSHELRTPLAAILGYAELMQEGFYEPLGKKSTDALTRIRSNGKHLLGLINTVLDIAKIESGQFSLNLGEYAIETVVETVRAATESLAETKKLALKTEVAKSLPIGFGDEQRLTQVLLNLVGNAIKFTDTGEVRITAKADNGEFAVSVADTGPGIPTDQLTRVFEQFHQVDSSNTKAKGGTGLGLAIAKQIVEMHGGRVWVESEPGHGATFLMQLPVRAQSRKTLQ